MRLKNYPDLITSNNHIHLMTHLVAGYPDIDTNKKLIYSMAKSGVKLIEIQIPFSDPMADGPTIMRANQISLNNGTNLEICFRLMEDMSKEVDIPLLFMTYGNIPFVYGMKEFVDTCSKIGCRGLIVPDLPYDEDTFILNVFCKQKDLPNIAVISPDTSIHRIKKLKEFAQGFIYTTLKIGITGAGNEIDLAGIKYIDFLKTHIQLPIAAGFGIAKPEHVDSLRGIADIAVIGSRLIELVDSEGVPGVSKFIKACLKK